MLQRAPTSDDVFKDVSSTPPPLPRKSVHISSCTSSPSVLVHSKSPTEKVFAPNSLGDKQIGLRPNQRNSNTLQPAVIPRNSKVGLLVSSPSVTNAESSANVTSSDVTNAQSSSKLVPPASATPEEKLKTNVVLRHPLSTSTQCVKQQAEAPNGVASGGATSPPGTIKNPDGKPLPSPTKPSSPNSMSPIHHSSAKPASSDSTSTAVTGSNDVPAKTSLTVKERMRQFNQNKTIDGKP